MYEQKKINYNEIIYKAFGESFNENSTHIKYEYVGEDFYTLLDKYLGSNLDKIYSCVTYTLNGKFDEWKQLFKNTNVTMGELTDNYNKLLSMLKKDTKVLFNYAAIMMADITINDTYSTNSHKDVKKLIDKIHPNSNPLIGKVVKNIGTVYNKRKELTGEEKELVDVILEYMDIIYFVTLGLFKILKQI